MNAQAILTPGGVADQLSRGLSGVSQAFVQRAQLQRQDRQQQFENNQTELRLALAQSAEDRAQAAQALQKAHDDFMQSHTTLQDNLAQNQDARQATSAANALKYNALDRGIVPAGVDAFKSQDPSTMQGGRAGVYGPPSDPSAYLTQEGAYAQRQRNIQDFKAEPRGLSLADRLALVDAQGAQHKDIVDTQIGAKQDAAATKAEQVRLANRANFINQQIAHARAGTHFWQSFDENAARDAAAREFDSQNPPPAQAGAKPAGTGDWKSRLAGQMADAIRANP